MKNKTYSKFIAAGLTIGLATFFICIIMILSSFESHKTPQLVFVSNDMPTIKAYIDLYYKSGWYVKSIECQSVSTSVNSRTNTNTAFYGQYRDIKGDIILILGK